MSRSRKTARSLVPRTTGSNPQELFKACEAIEQGLLAQHFGDLKKKWITDMTFGPLLPPDPGMQGYASLAKLSAPSGEDAQLLAGNYRFLLSSLKAVQSKDQVWLILAMWLKQLAVLQPEELLPADIFKRLTKTVRDHYRHLRPIQILAAKIVEAWAPYFGLLFISYCQLKGTRDRNIHTTLLKRGFDGAAIVLMSNPERTRRAPNAVAIAWASERLNLDQLTVANAHSVVFGVRRRQLNGISHKK